jgi:hypothetical protein
MRGTRLPSSVNNYLKCIGTFYNWLVDERVLTESPVAQVPDVRKVSLVRRFGRVSAVADEHERRAFLKQQKFFRHAVLSPSRLDPREDLRRVLSCVDGKFERRHCFEQ